MQHLADRLLGILGGEADLRSDQVPQHPRVTLCDADQSRLDRFHAKGASSARSSPMPLRTAPLRT